jgi:ubiquinol-cytochrome c reductase cytochrome b subunit
LWYFALLALMPHAVENYFMVLGPLLAWTILMALPLVSNKGERSPMRRPWAIAGMVMVVLMIGSLWYAGAKSPWSPNFNAEPLPAKVVGADIGSVAEGAKAFYSKGCLNCHLISGLGGRRGPDLSFIGNKLNRQDLVIRIVNGGNNMPAFGNNLTPEQLDGIVAFLQSRRKP